MRMSDLRTTRIGRLEPKTGGSTARPRGSFGGTPTPETGDRFFDGQSDIEGAFHRLRTLLAFDGEGGPREGVKRRGFYLNILV